MKYWVVSPNALADGRVEHFVNIMKKESIVLMGWGEDHALGASFKDIAVDDLVIVARGANRNKQVYLAGYAGTRSGDYPAEGVQQFRELTDMVDISGDSIPFNDTCAFRSADRIPAIYRLKEENPGDMAVVAAVIRRIQSTKERWFMTSVQQLLTAHRQLVLTGAPGTGKTFLARAIAEHETGGDETRRAFVQFHPSYDYSDFVEGLKPCMADQQIGFALRNGTFKEFCRKAGTVERVLFDKLRVRRSGKVEIADLECIRSEDIDIAHSDELVRLFWKEWLKDARSSGKAELPGFYFIIDEINRADLSRVFGELFYALEPSYRGPKGAVKTQYASLNTSETCFIKAGDDSFFVPSNVYIIGTMNDIDRSVESMDFALRRRFAWKELPADEPCFDRITRDGATTRCREAYRRLNDAIGSDPELGAAYQIGPAYFLNLEGDSDEAYTRLWQHHLRSILSEYLRGRPDQEQRLQSFGDAYWGRK